MRRTSKGVMNATIAKAAMDLGLGVVTVVDKHEVDYPMRNGESVNFMDPEKMDLLLLIGRILKLYKNNANLVMNLNSGEISYRGTFTNFSKDFYVDQAAHAAYQKELNGIAKSCRYFHNVINGNVVAGTVPTYNGCYYAYVKDLPKAFLQQLVDEYMSSRYIDYNKFIKHVYQKKTAPNILKFYKVVDAVAAIETM